MIEADATKSVATLAVAPDTMHFQDRKRYANNSCSRIFYGGYKAK
jgi:hypothetical protein